MNDTGSAWIVFGRSLAVYVPAASSGENTFNVTVNLRVAPGAIGARRG